MRDYTYQDMLRMQEDAANRVREMKKRAAIAVGDAEPEKKQNIAIPDEVRHISYPVELPQKEESKTEHSKELHHGIIDILKNDKDALLILALLVVLSGEENDYLTSLALVYLLL